jgi:hypothetical protein
MAADEGVGLVEGFDALAGADGDDFPELAGVDDGLDGGVEGCVAQDEAEGDAAVEGAGEGVEGVAAFEGLGGGFFQEHVVSEAERGAGVIEVIRILAGDDDHIGKFPGGEKRVLGIKGADAALRGEGGDGGLAARDGIRSGGDPVSVPHGSRDSCIGAASGAAAENGQLKRGHGEGAVGKGMGMG